MKAKILFAAIIFCMAYSSFPAEKAYLPTQERLRPLSLPRKTWKLDIGAELGAKYRADSLQFDFDGSLMNFQIPYIPLGNLAELYLLLPHLKLYPIKNVAIQDSFSIIDGPNLAILAGMRNFFLTEENGFSVIWGVGGGYQFKTFLAEKSWIFSNATGIIYSDFDCTANLDIGTGFQITDKFAIMVSLYGSVYDYIVNYVNLGIKESYNGYTVKLPIDFKINRNAKKGFLCRAGVKYMTNTYDYLHVWAGFIGFQYSWCF